MCANVDSGFSVAVASRHKTMIKVLEIDNLILKTCLADVSTGCSSPPQGEMNLDWVRLL